MTVVQEGTVAVVQAGILGSLLRSSILRLGTVPAPVPDSAFGCRCS